MNVWHYTSEEKKTFDITQVKRTKNVVIKMRLSLLIYNKIVAKDMENCEKKIAQKRNHWCLELLCQVIKLIVAAKLFMIFQV